MFLQISRLAAPLLFSLLLCVLAAPRQAKASGKLDLRVQASLVTASRFSLGEPIVLKYTIRNPSLEDAHAYMGPDQSDWVTETVTDAQGHTAPLKDEGKWCQKGGSHVNGVTVSPMSSATGYVVFNPWATIHAAGKYTLTVHTRLPYAFGAQAEEVAPSRYEDAGNVAVRDFTFPLNVTPHASRMLKQAAETFRQGVGDAKMRPWSSAATEALFSMPEADVSGVWQEMISDPTTPRYALGFAAEQLVRLHTPNAADLVAQMRWEPARPLETGETPIGVMELDEMSRLGDAGLRKHIDGLYAAHGDAHPYSFDVAD